MVSLPEGAARYDANYWSEFLTANPDVLNSILADLWTAVHGHDRKPSLEELWDLVGTKMSNLPFPEAFAAIKGTRSLRGIAQQVGVTHAQLSYWINGKQPIVKIHDVAGSMFHLESIAKALKVHPSYFVEWRRLWVLSVVDAVFDGRPNQTAILYKRYRGNEQKVALNTRSTPRVRRDGDC